MLKQPTVIHWFRQDLRLSDNPAFYAAASHGVVLPIYILDDENPQRDAPGAASRWWLHHSLRSLNVSLAGKLSVYRGDPLEILIRLVESSLIKGIYWTRLYEPWAIERDKRIKQELRQRGLRVQSENGSLLWEPASIRNKDGVPYKVFTPFYRKGCLNASYPRDPLGTPNGVRVADPLPDSLRIEQLRLLPKIRWDKSLEAHWTIGETAAQTRLAAFLDSGLSRYKDGRNFPAKPYVSRLSPHLHFGEISPHQVWFAVRKRGNDENAERFCCELGWREFSYNQLYYTPDLAYKNLRSEFDRFPWQTNETFLKAWQKGQTGIPLVDAGMRELWQTGYIHNRVRMIAGSFLVKNLLQDWRHGERWFWDCLVDADLASNSAGWQWIAGCGADAAPYFRIFNPVIQGNKFDPEGEYLRRFVPELRRLPLAYQFCPWQAPRDVLTMSGVILGETYPEPIVDLHTSREQALQAFHSLR